MLNPVNMFVGTDPEGFFERDGRIIGSEKVLGDVPVRGVVKDGVQFELNPGAATTVTGLGANLSRGFINLMARVNQVPGVSVNFNGVVEVEREELDSLSEKSRILGCQPSMNAYGERPITVNVKTYRKRSAGGHLHLGLGGTRIHDNMSVDDNRHRLPVLMDIFVGNTMVMLDRDLGAAERRENYGRAGEYRLPRHGVEYRTLSNFWLKDFALMDLAFGMAGVAVSTLNQSLGGDPIEEDLIPLVDVREFVKAIDTNNADLARANFERVRPFLAKHLPEKGFPINPRTIDTFLMFADAVTKKGLETFFPANPIEGWVRERQTRFTEFLGSLS